MTMNNLRQIHFNQSVQKRAENLRSLIIDGKVLNFEPSLIRMYECQLKDLTRTISKINKKKKFLNKERGLRIRAKILILEGINSPSYIHKEQNAKTNHNLYEKINREFFCIIEKIYQNRGGVRKFKTSLFFSEN